MLLQKINCFGDLLCIMVRCPGLEPPAFSFCNLLLDKNIKINWACPNGVRLDTLDEELLKLMEKSGCYSFAVGIESGSSGILKDMRRQVTLEKMREKFLFFSF